MESNPRTRGRTMSEQTVLTTNDQKLNDAWEEHLRAEFHAHSADEAIATMVANPLVNQVPVMIGGDGKEELHEFYAKYFLPQIPPDNEIIPVSRAIGQGRLVDEVVARFPTRSQWIGVAWHPADRKAGRDSAAGGGAIRRRQDSARALVLGSGLSAGAARAPAARRSAGRRGRGRAISA